MAKKCLIGKCCPTRLFETRFLRLRFPGKYSKVLYVFLQAGMESYPANEDYLLKLVYQGACENTVGLPLNVQVVGRPWQEELVLHVMKLLQDNVNFH